MIIVTMPLRVSFQSIIKLMKIVIQRVSEASVKVNNEITGEISKGLLLLVGVEEEDSQEDADWLAKKVLDLRIFSDEEAKI